MKKKLIILVSISMLFMVYTVVSQMLRLFKLMPEGNWNFVSLATAALSGLFAITALILLLRNKYSKKEF